LGRPEGLLGDVEHDDRVLAAAEQQDRALELGRDLTEDVDRLRLERLQMSQLIRGCGHRTIIGYRVGAADVARADTRSTRATGEEKRVVEAVGTYREHAELDIAETGPLQSGKSLADREHRHADGVVLLASGERGTAAPQRQGVPDAARKRRPAAREHDVRHDRATRTEHAMRFAQVR